MLTVTLNEENKIALLEPDGELSKNDFISAAELIDPFIEKDGKLNGIIIHTKSFPGWDSFSALLAHLKFVKDHHRLISHVALVTNSPVGGLGELVASHFVNAEIRAFPYDEMEESKQWILGDTSD
jgi:hypothetical protein